MANVKITDLTAYTDAASTDVLPIVDVSNNVTKKISISDILKATPAGTAALPAIAIDGDPNTGIWSPAADTLAVSTGGYERLRITSAGNVGIGISNPNESLHANGAIRSSGEAVSASANSTLIDFASNASRFISYGPNTTTYAPIQFLQATSNSSGISIPVLIDSSGRLLVGTSSSGGQTNARLQVAQTSSFCGEFTQYSNDIYGAWAILSKSRGAFGSQGLVSNGDELGLLGFAGSDGTAYKTAAQIIAYADGTPGANDMPGRLVFSTTADGASSPTERMRISNNGSLTVTGVGGSAHTLATNNAERVRWNDNGTYLTTLPTTASAANAHIWTGSSPANLLMLSTSSIRYKTDIEDLDNKKADALLNFRPVWYRSTCELDNKDWSWYGLIAEEVAEIEPRLVHWTYLDEAYEQIKNEDGSTTKQLKPEAELVPNGVQYDRLTVLLLDLVQRQNKRIETLETKVAALEAS